MTLNLLVSRECRKTPRDLLEELEEWLDSLATSAATDTYEYNRKSTDICGTPTSAGVPDLPGETRKKKRAKVCQQMGCRKGNWIRYKTLYHACSVGAERKFVCCRYVNVMVYLTTLATAEVISASPDVPEFCPAGILLHASMKDDDGNWNYNITECEQQFFFFSQFPDCIITEYFRRNVINLVDKFRATGCTERKKSVRWPTKVTEDAVEDARERMQRGPNKSVKKLAVEIGVSYGSAHKILRNKLG
ncbi:hypothetical protein ANN_24282 [Periplaneta americana]|uniref:Uncharacterized protein n=1 Tax=Periplaneta americana TaxID=6978 RepID=A0ABQ8S3D9_PERAM|nr:hypothetical protein ANN_24282 [Periplaneta americana]